MQLQNVKASAELRNWTKLNWTETVWILTNWLMNEQGELIGHWLTRTWA